MRLRTFVVLALMAVTGCRAPNASQNSAPPARKDGMARLDKSSEAMRDACEAHRDDGVTPFDANLPPGFAVSMRPRGLDFDVYDIKRGDVDYVGVYAGSFPSFPSEDAVAKKGRIIEAGGIKTYVVGSPGHERPIEYLIPTHRKCNPELLHVWVQDVPSDQATADKIAASIRPRAGA